MDIPDIAIDIVRTPTLVYWKMPNESILYGCILPDAFLDVDDVKENVVRRMELLDPNNPIPAILNLTQIKAITNEAKKLSSNSVSGLTVIAMLVKSTISRTIGNYALKVNRPVVPIRLFTSLNEAKKWVQSYM